MRKELAKNYNPAEFEDRIYANWCEKNYFAPDPDKKKKPFHWRDWSTPFNLHCLHDMRKACNAPGTKRN